MGSATGGNPRLGGEEPPPGVGGREPYSTASGEEPPEGVGVGNRVPPREEPPEGVGNRVPPQVRGPPAGVALYLYIMSNHSHENVGLVSMPSIPFPQLTLFRHDVPLDSLYIVLRQPYHHGRMYGRNILLPIP